MSNSAHSIYASAPFKFVIDGNPLYIHAELVSRNSKPLDRMINGHMSEAQKGFAVIQDVDEDTFVRFIQWAYNGFYEAGRFNIDQSQPSSDNEVEVEAPPILAEPSPECIVEGWGSFGSGKKHRKKSQIFSIIPDEDASTGRSTKQSLKEEFIHRKPMIRQESISIPPPRPNQEPNEDYTEVFLSHARVYVFAEIYDIQQLKALALDELHGTLNNFDLHLGRTSDIIALLRYVYANTGEPLEGNEDMRTVLTHYVGIEMDTLMMDDEFRLLMIEDGGALLGDFMAMVAKRIR